MQCLHPRTVGFLSDGKTISWSPKTYSKEFATFQLPCGKCPLCKLQQARETAIRCMHEAQMHEKNSFITLTYRDESLKSPKLIYEDFQLFVKKLRTQIFSELLERTFPNVEQKEQRKLWRNLPKDSRDRLFKPHKISILVTGEYGGQNKRPHWHAIIFNWRPNDLVYRRSNEHGDQIYTSKTLESLWTHNDPNKVPNEIGDVTFRSAMYCARYALKDYAHGKPGTHEFQSESHRSSHQAIGKTWIEKYWKTDCFNQGFILLPDGQKAPIPRYYEKWLKKIHPTEWERYFINVKIPIIKEATRKEEKITAKEKWTNFLRSARLGLQFVHQTTRSQTKKKILEQRIKNSNQNLKDF